MTAALGIPSANAGPWYRKSHGYRAVGEFFGARRRGDRVAIPISALHFVRFWHKADMSGSGLLLCKLTPEPHFAGRKSLM
jgi:hypothetical protein